MTACEVCESSAGSPLYDGLLTRCRDCGYVWADVDIDPDSIRALYGPAYFHGNEYSDYLADRPALQKNFAARFATLRKHLVPGVHRKLFEIGCAYGLFLNLVRPAFDAAAGIDISEEAVAFAKGLGLDVRQGDLLTADFAGERYDVVCAWDTIEHLGRPAAYVRAAGRMMPEGGLLALTTGDIGSANARLRGRYWRLIHPPTHLHYFSAATMKRLLDRCGFDVVHLEHCGSHRSLGNMLHNVVALRWKRPALGARLAQSWLQARYMYVNLFDVMYVIARKR